MKRYGCTFRRLWPGPLSGRILLSGTRVLRSAWACLWPMIGCPDWAETSFGLAEYLCHLGR